MKNRTTIDERIAFLTKRIEWLVKDAMSAKTDRACRCFLSMAKGYETRINKLRAKVGAA